MDRSGKSWIPFVSLKMAGLKDKTGKNNLRKQEDAGLIISIKPTVICLLQDKNGESCKLKFRKLQVKIPKVAIGNSIKLQNLLQA